MIKNTERIFTLKNEIGHRGRSILLQKTLRVKSTLLKLGRLANGYVNSYVNSVCPKLLNRSVNDHRILVRENLHRGRNV